MKDGIVILELEDRPIGKNAPQASGEALPFRGAVEIVDHEETSAVQILADPPGLAVIQLPIANLDRIEPRTIVDFVAVDIDDLLDRARVDARVPANGLDELSLRLVRVGAPTAA